MKNKFKKIYLLPFQSPSIVQKIFYSLIYQPEEQTQMLVNKLPL